MTGMKAPRTLRTFDNGVLFNEVFDGKTGRKVTVGCLIAVASISGAEAQQSPLPPVTVDAPVVRKKPAVTKPTAEQLRARAALRAAHARSKRSRLKQAAAQTRRKLRPTRDPYADPAAPYKVNHLQASGQVYRSQSSIRQRRSRCSPRNCLRTRMRRALKEVGRTTAASRSAPARAGMPLVTAFSFAASTRVTTSLSTVSAIPAVNIRENFFTEQVEILKGPSSSIDGRGTTGGAIEHRHQAGQDGQKLLQC